MSLRERVFLPQEFGRKSLIDRLLFAVRASATLAAVHYFGTLHFVVPSSRQDVVGGAFSVLHHPCHLRRQRRQQSGIPSSYYLDSSDVALTTNTFQGSALVSLKHTGSRNTNKLRTNISSVLVDLVSSAFTLTRFKALTLRGTSLEK